MKVLDWMQENEKDEDHDEERMDSLPAFLVDSENVPADPGGDASFGPEIEDDSGKGCHQEAEQHAERGEGPGFKTFVGRSLLV